MTIITVYKVGTFRWFKADKQVRFYPNGKRTPIWTAGLWTKSNNYFGALTRCIVHMMTLEFQSYADVVWKVK